MPKSQSLSVVLTTAALFLQNLARTNSLGPGFDTLHTLRAEVYLPPRMYRDNRTIDPYVKRAVEGLRAIPGIESAAAARIIPFTDATNFDVSPNLRRYGAKATGEIQLERRNSLFLSCYEYPASPGATRLRTKTMVVRRSSL